MGIHNVGFYDKRDMSKQVILFYDVGSIDDSPKLVRDIHVTLSERIGTYFDERGYNFLCEVLAKHNISKEKRQELKELFGSNLRYGVLD